MSVVGYLSDYGKCKLSIFVWYISRCSQTLFEPRRERTSSVRYKPGCTATDDKD